MRITESNERAISAALAGDGAAADALAAAEAPDAGAAASDAAAGAISFWKVARPGLVAARAANGATASAKPTAASASAAARALDGVDRRPLGRDAIDGQAASAARTTAAPRAKSERGEIGMRS
ncbi:hypothetical protein WT60_12270 [Burkholderia sp. MSMB617WGS]|nr:hypothetical protein WS78_12070 [Burkholderia savannae]AOK47533.1 hypothetical protein WT60_12270 [Burkholderia sp. MSMB617WGS]KVG37529.1 hypothetical protein WS77_02300 [Burkholderia sp. MSMB0265]KVG88207.1 hypothetical protein WS81_24925 [Burkholderia sp. MSMB2040]KVG93757.1 hypothetical protein WS82_08420 [Burkholderia sp. MSMB2041]KVH01011.1 hypothetical protein WS83_19985 [Burkholderia sp. MSMB2042]KVK89956.1 hypothetical protein WS91_27820 [Burkholderia sp. MSMB1498]